MPCATPEWDKASPEPAEVDDNDTISTSYPLRSSTPTSSGQAGQVSDGEAIEIARQGADLTYVAILGGFIYLAIRMTMRRRRVS